ncbi:MAG: transposase [Planctomycetes bacterium]|nr:transposase [Planctomycetota bacterium]
MTSLVEVNLARRKWRIATKAGFLPKSALGEAIAYANLIFCTLSRHIMQGYLGIDNNFVEKTLKDVVRGRKFWLFAGSGKGGRGAMTIYTLIQTAERRGVNPYVYHAGPTAFSAS